MRRGMLAGGIVVAIGLGASAAVLGSAGGKGGVAESCAAAASVPWTVKGHATYRVDAAAAGPDCASANVTLTVRAANGATMLTFTSAAADLAPVFGEAQAPTEMAAALRRWIGRPRAGLTTRQWPVWDVVAKEPGRGLAMFHPEPLISRAYYEDVRRWGQPAFCFRQGAVSEGCYALDTQRGRLALIGTRLPGHAAI